MSGVLSMEGLNQMLHAERSKMVYVVLMVLLLILVLVSWSSTGTLMGLWSGVVANGVDRAHVDKTLPTVVAGKSEFKRRRGDPAGFIGAMRPNMVETGQANIAREDESLTWNARALSGDFKDIRGRHEFRPKRADAQLVAHNL